MNYQQFKKCICDLSNRVAALEGGGAGGGCVAEYDAGTEYLAGNMVCFEGAVYVALQDTDGYDPIDDGVIWTQIGSLLSNTNTWNTDLAYPTGTIVYHDGAFYIANADTSPAEEPGVDANWTALTAESEFDYGMALALNTGNYFA